jgi:hypothetical protein
MRVQRVEHLRRPDVFIAAYQTYDSGCVDHVRDVFVHHFEHDDEARFDVTRAPLELSATRVVGGPAIIDYLVLPPLGRCIGLSATSPLVRSVLSLVRRSDRVVAIGSGMYLLAAADLLIGRRVAARGLRDWLSILAPGAVLSDRTFVVDGGLGTAIDGEAAGQLCRAMLGGADEPRVRSDLEPVRRDIGGGRHSTRRYSMLRSDVALSQAAVAHGHPTHQPTNRLERRPPAPATTALSGR